MKTSSASSLALAALLVSLLPGALVGCGTTDEPKPPSTVESVKVARSSLQRDRSPAVDTPTLTQLVRDNDNFAVELYKRLGAGKSSGKNMFFSGASISSAFAMLSGGARGDSEREIAQGLRFTLPQDRLHPAMNKLALEMEARAQIEGSKGSDGKGFRLAMNNSFWGEQSTRWEQPYLDVLAVNYDAGINLVDFAGNADGARSTINAWTEEKTEQRVKELLPAGSLDSSTRFVLVNTVYFNAAWLEEFSETSLRFTKSGGEEADVAALQQVSKDFRWAESDDAEVVAVPYEGRQMEFVAVLPKSLDTFEAGLDGAKLEDLFARLGKRYVNLVMPKVRIEGATISLKDELQALGLTHVFGGGDFSGMSTSTPLTLDEVFHQAFVKVNEKGTEAAAATAIVGRETSAVQDPPKDVRLNKPYLFFVRDVPTGAVLFTGRVVAPEYKE